MAGWCPNDLRSKALKYGANQPICDAALPPMRARDALKQPSGESAGGSTGDGLL